MKKSLLIVLSMMLSLFLVGSAIAGLAPASGITDSYHDLGTTAATYGDAAEQGAQNRICVYCHAPHNTIKLGSAAAVDGMGNPVQYLPLWNHTITDMPGFDMYNNGPLEPTDAQHMSTAKAIALQPQGVSILCLSCHDGSVATNAYGVGTGAVGAANTFMAGRALIGGLNPISGRGDLTNHHPVSFSYTQVEAVDNEIRPAATTAMGPNGKMIIDFLYGADNMLECSSCHEVHNGPEVEGVRLTYVDDTRSAFCLTCHLK
ncbi:MAG: hypothetical protein WAV13_14815 [Thermodesulfovibrionales bacterium]